MKNWLRIWHSLFFETVQKMYQSGHKSCSVFAENPEKHWKLKIRVYIIYSKDIILKWKEK